MKLLRDDLVIYPAEDSSKKFFVQNPSTNGLYEFDEKEYYLINALKSPYHERVLLTKFNAKFGEKATLEFLTDFIATLDAWELLTDNSERNVSEKHTSKAEKQSPDAFQLTNTKYLNHWSWFCPETFLDKLVGIVQLFRYFVVLLPLLFLVAVVGFISNMHLFEEDLPQGLLLFNFIQHTIYCMFTINLMTVTVKGCIARYFKLRTPSFGVMLAYGLIPEFDIRINIEEKTDRKTKLWLCSASTWVRLFLISIGIILWLVLRQRGTTVSILGIALAWYSLFTLFIIANPLLGGDGYRFLAVYFRMPDLRQKANRSLRYLFSTPPAVIAKYTDKNFALRSYALLSIFLIISILIFVGHTLGHWLKENYRGLGIVLFVAIIVYLIFRYRHLSKASKALRRNIQQTKQMPFTDKASADGSGNQNGTMPSTFISGIRRVRWLRCLFTSMVVILFLPYQYETGGSAVVSPVLNQRIYSESKGIVEKVYYNGGEWLPKGTLIAEMQHYRQEKDVELTRHAIDKKREEINILLTTPLDEEVEMAKEELLTAKLKFKYSQDDYNRAETLYKEEIASLVTYLDAKARMELDQQDAAEREANLIYIENQVNEHTIESGKLELAILLRELQFYEEELERTKLRMPNDGRIITMNLQNLENKFLDDSVFLAEIEVDSRVQIEILIPESDISQISVGGKVQFKPQLYPNKAITGQVTFIYPVTEKASFGTVLKVVSVIPNENFFLKTGMTGYAKIEGDEMLVVQAFTRALISFFLIEFWSWLP
jgi:putative peptide zinc metalloprotease protein